jgi:hypothetical protein
MHAAAEADPAAARFQCSVRDPRPTIELEACGWYGLDHGSAHDKTARRVVPHGRRADAQRPGVAVSVGVPHAAGQAARDGTAPVRQHGPGVDPQTRRAQPARGPFKKTGRAHLDRAQRRATPAGHVGAVVDRGFPGHDPVPGWKG